jgi:hypothetical protein
LAAAGYGPSHRLALDLYFEESSALNKTLSVQIQSLLAPLGIDVRMHPQLSSLLYGGYGANGTLARGRYDIALYNWIAGISALERPLPGVPRFRGPGYAARRSARRYSTSTNPFRGPGPASTFAGAFDSPRSLSTAAAPAKVSSRVYSLMVTRTAASVIVSDPAGRP